MKKLRMLLIVALVLAFATAAFAVPIVNNPFDSVEQLSGGIAYGYYQNSGSWLFTVEGNDNNVTQVETLLQGMPGYEDVELMFADVIFTNYNNAGMTSELATNSGTWAVNPATSTIEFYSVKAGNSFAMYSVNPAESTGSWSTYDLWLAGEGGREGVEISHFTGFNPRTTSVPEPSTLLLFGSGLLGLGFFGRKKFRK